MYSLWESQEFKATKLKWIEFLVNQTNAEKDSELCPPALMNEGYLFGEEIGSGSYSKVYKAKKKSDPDKDFSVKRIDINKVPHEWK